MYNRCISFAYALFLLWILTSTPVSIATQQVGRKNLPFELQEGLTYGPNERNDFDIFLPKDDSEQLRPCVIVIHGGGWRGGDKKQLRILAEVFARRGYVVATINYRLAPKWSYPAQLDDAQLAVRWLRKNADKFQIDPKRFGAVGASAGGHLSALLGTRETRDNNNLELKDISSKVQCVFDIFGPVDLTDEGYVQASLNLPEGKVLLDFLGKRFDEAPDIWREASPIFHVSSDDAAFFILHGDKDPIVPLNQSKRFAEALKAAGVKVQLVVVEGMGHGLDGSPEILQKVLQAVGDALNFFDQNLQEK